MESREDSNCLLMVQMLAKGGAQRVASQLINHFPGAVPETILYEKNIDYDCESDPIILNSSPGVTYLDKLFQFFKRIRKVRTIKRNNQPDVTISISDGPNLVNICSKEGDALVISVHSHKSKNRYKDPIKRWIYHYLYSLLYNRADKVVTASRGIKKDLIENFNVDKRKIKVIHNAIEISKISQQASETLTKKKKRIFDKQVIIHLGRLHQAKGQWHLIRAFRKVSKEKSQAKLVFLGNGEEKKYLSRLAEDLNLDVYCDWRDKDLCPKKQEVFFFGFVQNPFKYLSRADIFAFPSLWEGFGIAMIEAAACGLSIVASDCHSGPREILAPEMDIGQTVTEPDQVSYGILMPVCDGKKYRAEDPLTREEKHWAKMLLELLENDSLRSKYSALATSRASDFSISRMMKSWNNLIDNVIEKLD